MPNSSKSAWKNSILIRYLFGFAVPILGLVMIWAVMGSKTASAGENIWTWAGVSGYVDQIITDPVNPSIAYARIGDGRLMKSVDGGNNWVNIADSQWNNLFHISMAVDSPNVLYATTNFGIFITTNGGTTWELSYPPNMVTGVAVSPVDWQVAYLADQSSYDLGESVITRTVDGGQTWHTLSTDLPSGLALQDDVGSAITNYPSICF